MQLFRHTEGIPDDLKGGVVAIGNFDGVHLGHRIVLDEARSVAADIDAPLGVLSFEPHPRSLFRPDAPPFRLTPFRVRAHLLQALGVDLHVVLTFDREFSERSAENFVEEIVVGGLAARHVVIGYDFHFGHKRRGDADLLRAMGKEHAFGVSVVTQAGDEAGDVYSSSRVRELLQKGDPKGAAALLGRAWTIEGRVDKGDQRGRDLGYPTANITLGDHLRPAYGVYAVRCAIEPVAGQPSVWLDGVANLGIRPMWRTEEPLLEVHLFDFDGDIYGNHVAVELVDYLRGEMHFDDVEALIAQMDRDSEQARKTLVQLSHDQRSA
ncbi:MAG: bifunctional riboflavin kinase/FAD synthetase [Pseudomonadota bacterium]